ncbi:MAG: type II secretion system protein GspJ [Alphaproteobacteria bacterium]
MKPQTARPRFEGGFTLLEVVLALSIFGLIGAILYGAFSLTQGAVTKSQASFEKSQKLRSFGDLLGSYIRSSYPYRASAQDPAIFYQGGEDSLTFVSSFSLAMGGRGMAKIHLYREGDAGKNGFLKLDEESPVRFDDDDDESGQRSSITLQKGVGSLQISYLDPQSADENWEDNWDGEDRRMLPRAVRLTYRTQDGREARWVFPVMMNVLAR